MLILYNIGIKGNRFALENYSVIRDMQSFPGLIAAVSFFMLFKNIKINYSKKINCIATNTFGVYLLHTHETSIPIFWRNIFKLDVISKTDMYFPWCICLVICIFFVTIIVEYARKKLEDLVFTDNVKNVMKRIDNKINEII